MALPGNQSSGMIASKSVEGLMEIEKQRVVLVPSSMRTTAVAPLGMKQVTAHAHTTINSVVEQEIHTEVLQKPPSQPPNDP